MITGQLKNQIDQVWLRFFTGGIANGLTVIEQITYLLFARRLDEIHTAREKQAALLKKPIEKPVFSGKQQHLRWSKFKDYDPEKMFKTFRDEVFPFIKALNIIEGAKDDQQSAYTRMMKDATFVIPTPGLLERAVTLLAAINMDDRDTKGDVYEYLLSKLQTEGRNGQFRTPRHVIRMMVNMVAPTPDDLIADPACGTCGFLMEASEYLREHHGKTIFNNKKKLAHFTGTAGGKGMFHGNDFDATMLRIGTMNMLLHGIEHPDVRGEDSLSELNTVRDAYTLILANPPFKGSLDYDATSKDLLVLSRTKKTELLFIALFLKQLKPGGRCACIVPDGVLFGASKAHVAIRQELVDGHKLDGVVSMPSGIFKPYSGVSTAILLFTRTDSGGTDSGGGVWFYDMTADGYSLDDKRDPVDANDIPDVIKQWQNREALLKGKPTGGDRKAKAFFVPADEIRQNKYDLSINRYKEVEYEAVEYDPPEQILDELEVLEKEITKDLKELRGMLT